MIRRLLRSALAHRLAQAVLFWYVRLVFYTTRWSFVGFEALEAHCQREGPFILMLWHNRVAMMPFAWSTKRRPLMILTSGHRDGRLVSDVMGRFGVENIPVQSKQSGGVAARAALRALRGGAWIGITPDGPRGPRMRMKGGTTVIARLGGTRISLIAYATRRGLALNSWDRMLLPLPFDRGVFLWDAGIVPEPGHDANALRDDLERRLTQLTDRADRMMGRAPILAADAPRRKRTP